MPYIKALLPGQKYTAKFSILNARGIGGFKNDSIAKFKNVISNNQDYNEFVVALCYDTDVFEFASKPPIDWKKVDKRMKKAGAKRVIHIKAKKSIEDWILYAKEDICKWLRIPVTTTIQGKSGYEKLKKLFMQKNKVYIKGRKVEGLLEHIDTMKIISAVKNEINPLIQEFKK